MPVESSINHWPDTLDAVVTAIYLLAVLALPALGYFYMVIDFRAYLRSLRRALVVVGAYFGGMPAWARVATPPPILAMGLTLPCTEADLLRAYRARVKQLHPDRGGDKQRFMRLQLQFEEALQYLRSHSAGHPTSSNSARPPYDPYTA
jgi:hypothetical protein